MTTYIRLAEAPTLLIQDPYCSACESDCEDTGDEWLCPTCGTAWGRDDYDRSGTLYETWSGQTLPGPTVATEDAWVAAAKMRAGRSA